MNGLYDSYIICATPRTGSTLLCDLMSTTGVAGHPDSFYRLPSISWWARRWGVPDQETLTERGFHQAYLEAVRHHGKGKTGVFGMRLMKENVNDLSYRLGMLYPDLKNDRARFEKAFGRTLYVHLSRGDKVTQAVSLVKAMQSGLWHMAPDGTELERLMPSQKLAYDAGHIRRVVAELDTFDLEWVRWFEGHQIEPHCVTYEALSDDPSVILAGVLTGLGLGTGSAVGIEPGTAKLSDDINLNWIERYNGEGAGADNN